MTAWETGTYEMKVSLFGFIPLKTIQVEAIEEAYAIPCGCPVGIYMATDGIMVIDSGTVTDIDGNEVSPAGTVLQPGDYIVAVNGETMENKDALIDVIEASNGEELIFTVRRKQEEIEVPIRPVLTQTGTYKAGIWVRDDMQGIGTLTFVTENQVGALGHGVNDADTGLLVEASEGELRKANILSITKGSVGTPGSVVGTVDYTEEGWIGSIDTNTECGILGTVSNLDWLPEDVEQTAVPIGLKQDAHIGSAILRSDVSGEMKDYEIQITAVHMGGAHSTKGLEIQVTDEELLEVTGGIIQGMSGSPILQDGKLIGAVTHVFVNQPEKGYGIFLEDMLEQ
jgi:stage IV sporulation protein B